MWETLHSIADWEYFRILLLLVIMKTQNWSRWNSLYLREWNIRSHKLDVQETSFSLTQFCPTWSDVVRCKSTWKELPLLICGMILQFNPEHGATCCVINTVKNIPTKERRNSRTRRKIWVGQMLITSRQAQKLSRFGALFYLLLWRHWSNNEDDCQKRKSDDMTRIRTHRVALEQLTESINLDQNNPEQSCWYQKPTRQHSAQEKFLKKWMESPSLFVQHFQFIDVSL